MLVEHGIALNTWNLISISVVALFYYPFIKFIETGNLYYMWFGICASLLDLSTKVIKAFTVGLGKPWQRPEGARGCDILCSMDKESAGKPGFPSGHATAVAFFATVLFLGARNQSNHSNERVRVLAFGVVMVAAVCASRYKKNCHNAFQLVAGVMYGCAAGIIFYRLSRSGLLMGATTTTTSN
jgi:membrane-associated phospholipid phosphatase